MKLESEAVIPARPHVSPGSDAGRGLKLVEIGHALQGVIVSPGSDAGRGLKLHYAGIVQQQAMSRPAAMPGAD